MTRGVGLRFGALVRVGSGGNSDKCLSDSSSFRVACWSCSFAAGAMGSGLYGTMSVAAGSGEGNGDWFSLWFTLVSVRRAAGGFGWALR